MSLSIYQASIPVFIRMLDNLAHILDKAATYAEGKKIDTTVFVHDRLAPDMFEFSRQIQIASDTVKGCGARLAQIEVPKFADTETTFPELQERINKTISFLKTIKPEQLEGSEERDITLKVGPQELHFTGQQYLSNFVLPNFYFHVSMAYAILRHNGVDLGKRDYLGAN